MGPSGGRAQGERRSSFLVRGTGDSSPQIRLSGSEEWYDAVARSRPPKDRPWYHVLVEGQDHTTYVAERHLEADPSGGEIRHPRLGDFFDTFDAGIYRRSAPFN